MGNRVIYVFGSNAQGIHGAGQALEAKQKWGAVQGIGRGLQGNSYAVPTKHTPYKRMKLFEIANEVQLFLIFARQHRELTFKVLRLGCGRAGYTDKDIAPLFVDAPPNCILPQEWQEYL